MIDISSLDPEKILPIRVSLACAGKLYPEFPCGLKKDGDILVADPSWLVPLEDRIPTEPILLDPRYVEARGWPHVLFYVLEVPLHATNEQSTQSLIALLDRLAEK